MKNSKIEEFWSMLCSEDEQIQYEGQCKRMQFFLENEDYFRRTNGLLPKDFAQIYKNMSFHDFQILEFHLDERQRHGAVVSIVVYDFHEDYGKNVIFKIVYEGVEEHSITINSNNHRLNWAYDIFEHCENGLWVHRIMCSDAKYDLR